MNTSSLFQPPMALSSANTEGVFVLFVHSQLTQFSVTPSALSTVCTERIVVDKILATMTLLNTHMTKYGIIYSTQVSLLNP